MRATISLAIVGLLMACAFSGCVGGKEATEETISTGADASSANNSTANATEKKTIVYEGDVQAGANPGYLEPTIESLPGTGVIDYKLPITSKTKISVKLTWGAQTSDFDLKFYDPKGAEIASSGGTATTEEAFEYAIKKNFGEYVVRVIPFAVVNEHYICTITIG
ncbi:MAG: hypothetical protein PHH26_03380 [Candidatus Thermoplasmatota archaeon]|nr:hypothetical protein [Candidatus Thermoplasmatota archaeon]